MYNPKINSNEFQKLEFQIMDIDIKELYDHTHNSYYHTNGTIKLYDKSKIYRFKMGWYFQSGKWGYIPNTESIGTIPYHDLELVGLTSFVNFQIFDDKENSGLFHTFITLRRYLANNEEWRKAIREEIKVHLAQNKMRKAL